MCKNEGFPEKNQKTPSNFIFYPKVCYHLSRYSPGNLKKLGRVALYKVIEKMACTAHSYYQPSVKLNPKHLTFTTFNFLNVFTYRMPIYTTLSTNNFYNLSTSFNNFAQRFPINWPPQQCRLLINSMSDQSFALTDVPEAARSLSKKSQRLLTMPNKRCNSIKFNIQIFQLMSKAVALQPF